MWVRGVDSQSQDKANIRSGGQFGIGLTMNHWIKWWITNRQATKDYIGANKLDKVSSWIKHLSYTTGEKWQVTNLYLRSDIWQPGPKSHVSYTTSHKLWPNACWLGPTSQDLLSLVTNTSQVCRLLSPVSPASFTRHCNQCNKETVRVRWFMMYLTVAGIWPCLLECGTKTEQNRIRFPPTLLLSLSLFLSLSHTHTQTNF